MRPGLNLTGAAYSPPLTTAGAGRALSEQAFAQAMAAAGLRRNDFSPAFPLFVAVSGGADSSCVALFARRWLNDDRCLVCLVVDHGLRAASKVEANRVLQQFRDRGIQCEKLTRPYGPIPSAVEEKAREARYGLIDAFIRARFKTTGADGSAVLLTGHHQDDQLETFLLRLERGSNLRGLACMSVRTHFALRSFEIVRPLLAYRKAALVSALKAGFPDWVCVEDGSNSDPAFRRNWLRLHGHRLFAQNSEPGNSESAQTLRLISLLGRLRSCIESRAVAVLGTAAVQIHDAGIARLERAAVMRESGAVQSEIIRRLIALLAPAGFKNPNLKFPDRLLTKGGTLAHVVVRPSGKFCYFFACQKRWLKQQRAGIPPPPATSVFDGRFQGLCAGTASNAAAKPVAKPVAEPVLAASFVGRRDADVYLKALRTIGIFPDPPPEKPPEKPHENSPKDFSVASYAPLPSYVYAALACLRVRESGELLAVPALGFVPAHMRQRLRAGQGDAAAVDRCFGRLQTGVLTAVNAVFWYSNTNGASSIVKNDVQGCLKTETDYI